MLDPSKIDEQLVEARRECSQQHVWLSNALQNFAISNAAVDTNPRTSFMFALEQYVDARARVILLELIQGPDFYSALMRSAAEVPPDAS